MQARAWMFEIACAAECDAPVPNAREVARNHTVSTPTCPSPAAAAIKVPFVLTISVNFLQQPAPAAIAREAASLAPRLERQNGIWS